MYAHVLQVEQREVSNPDEQSGKDFHRDILRPERF